MSDFKELPPEKKAEITRLVNFWSSEREHFRECMQKGFMSPDECERETMHLIMRMKQGICRVLLDNQ